MVLLTMTLAFGCCRFNDSLQPAPGQLDLRGLRRMAASWLATRTTQENGHFPAHFVMVRGWRRLPIWRRVAPRPPPTPVSA